MYGNGIMPLTFAAFKGQRFRWAFGGIQILRKHWRGMLPGPRTDSNRLGFAQRFDYLISGLMWFNDVLHLGFALILIATAYIVVTNGSIELRPLRGAIILLPAALIASGVIRALWSLRVRAGLSFKRCSFAFLNWLSCSWVTALACIQHAFRSEATFLRTPKEGKERSVWAALNGARVETAIAVALWGAGIAVIATGHGTVFLAVLFAWQGLVYGAAPIMSWLNVRSELAGELRERREADRRRALLGVRTPFYAGAAALIIAGAGVFAVGGSQPVDPSARTGLFQAPKGASTGGSPLSALGESIARGVDEIVPSSSSSPEPDETDAPPDDGTQTDAPVETDARTAAPTEEPAPPPESTAEPEETPAPAPEAPEATTAANAAP